jgi:hypothetical protein
MRVPYLRGELRDVEAPDDGRKIRVEKRVRNNFSIPDIVIDDRLVLELKLGPHEGEKDRLIAQCCKYSAEWVTWAVVLGMSRRKARKPREAPPAEEPALHRSQGVRPYRRR